MPHSEDEYSRSEQYERQAKTDLDDRAGEVEMSADRRNGMGTQKIAVHAVSAAAPTHQRDEWTPDRVDLLKRIICRGSTDDEFRLFLGQCRRTGLDPFNRQIHTVKRWNSQARREEMQIQTGIDGFRLIAERTGNYDGQDEPLWCGEDGVWRDVWLSGTPPAASKVVIHRKDCSHSFVGVARFGAYVQTKKDGSPNAFWLRMGDVMIAKCAEALALRKAFPQQLSGLYTSDEMAQANNGEYQTGETRQEIVERRTQEIQNRPHQQEVPPPATEPQEQPTSELPLIVREAWAQMGTLTACYEMFATAKRKLTDTLGTGVGGEEYYRILGKHGVEHANEFKRIEKARVCVRDLLLIVEAEGQQQGDEV